MPEPHIAPMGIFMIFSTPRILITSRGNHEEDVAVNVIERKQENTSVEYGVAGVQIADWIEDMLEPLYP